MIKVSNTFKNTDIDGISRYEIWYQKDEIKRLKEVICSRRYILQFIAYFLVLLIVIPVAFIYIYLGFLNDNGGKVFWGIIIFIIGFLYLVSQYYPVKNMENYLLADGVAYNISGPAYNIRKPLMKKLGKRYWFAYMPFSAIESMERKDITSETSALLIHTKDGKTWPHPKYGIPYNRTIKGDVKFIKEIFMQYEKWKSEHEEK
jgi:hypothetical protein